MTKIPFTLRAEESEVEFWKKNAGKNLSEWIRKTLNNAAAGAKDAKVLTGYFCGTFDGTFNAKALETAIEDITQEDVTKQEDRLPQFQNAEPDFSEKPKKAKTCPHGKPRGHHCGLCGGKAKVK